jgi:hypothetical protein
MATDQQRQALRELYQGEVTGEAVFDKMLHHLDDDRQRYIVATMLQLETETKARLRPHAARLGLDLAENPQHRADGEALAAQLADATWTAKMQSLHDILNGTYVPRYIEIAATAAPEIAEIAAYMVAHETSLLEVTKRELTGNTINSVETVIPQLRHPIPAPIRVGGR